ncbi:MAG: PolC-type DNA polymerase III [Erysipelotrichaceae bacterium]|nr:PolC-type DNA polymerase III [Erysipelotrichaceae bacterium]
MATTERMIRFLESIGISNTDDFDMEFISCTKSSVDDQFFMFCIKKETPWDFGLLDQYLLGTKQIKYKCNIDFTYGTDITCKDIEKLIKDFYFNRFFIEADFKVLLNGSECVVDFPNDDGAEEFYLFLDDLKDIFKVINYHFNLKLFVNEKPFEKECPVEEDTVDEPINEEAPEVELTEEEILHNEAKEQSKAKAVNEYEETFYKNEQEKRTRELYRRGDYSPFAIENIDENSGAVDVDGKVFEVDVRTTKKGKIFAKIGIKDNVAAIYATIFEGRSITKELIDSLAPGVNVKIKGRVDLDKYSHTPCIICHTFTILPPDLIREDKEINKRVELHLHTHMSEMDGLPSVADYCKLAKNMEMKGFAITDHGVVQAFPEADDCASKYGLKIIYGSELYVIDNYFQCSLKPRDIDLDKATYIVFDLESTGLNIRYDRITEIGAVKIANGIVVDHFDQLVNPGIRISDFIASKTKITNELVKDCPKIKDALPSFLKFIGNDPNTILVSHNIEFDYNLLNEEIENNGFPSLEFSAIDTLAISHFLNPENMKHNLGAVASRCEVSYDQDSAHRGDYDAEVLANCWFVLKNRLKAKLQSENSKNKYSLQGISKLEMCYEYLKKWNRGGYHTVVLAKNVQGIIDLNHIISESHINHIGAHPFVPKELLEQYRHNLIVGSACANGEVFYCALRRNGKALAQAISNCDYIEIQPLENYSYLVYGGEVPSPENLKANVMDIINEANRQNKLIVATGDCHYLNPDDKKYRDIFIESSAVGGALHPLKHFSEGKYYYPNPDQHFRNTEEMLECFAWLGKDKAFEYVVTNSNKIFNMVDDNVRAIPKGIFPPKIDNCENMLRDLCFNKAHELYGNPLPKIIEDRLETELDGIISHGYAVIYYISHKLVSLTNKAGYLVGSRGSVGSSFAATMSGITEVNPLPPHYRCPHCKHFELYEGKDIMSGFDLPDKLCPECGTLMEADGQNIWFQTFLGFEAEKTPDIDLNFPTDFQPKAHLFTKELLGADHVFRAGTIGTVQFKTAFGYVKNYFEKFHISANSAWVSANAYGCCEVKRTTGQHPGGIVVVPRDHDVNDFCAVQYPANDPNSTWMTTHYDFGSVHDTILKFDMLGHVDPQAAKMMSVLSGYDCFSVPFNDKKVLSLFTTDDALHLQHKYLKPDNGALGLPEFGTKLTRAMLRETQPVTFNDLLIISGLSHGTDVWANNQQDLVKNGVIGFHDVIGCRDDIMTYLIGLGMPSHEAFVIMETVRKKDKFLKDSQIDLMKKFGVPEYYIEACKKIVYLFPRGHACAYVNMAIRVAYYKVYYPLEYYATFFTLRCDNYDINAMIGGIDSIYNRLKELNERKNKKGFGAEALTNKEENIITSLDVCLEMLERGYSFANISLEKSDATNFVIDKEHNQLIPPFKVLDGLGDAAGTSLMKARSEKPFSSFKDLKKRSGLSQTNIKDLKALGVLKNLPEDTDNNFDNGQMSLF